ncbi:MAG: UDP-N-acetylmuramoyl-tripeptide--D-alanyl-D-alanine ligase [Deltaproteobacteria bacterium HGW-Deltaproteobacteria-14]|nr:MAG: UDP-N-acetylmuramoyl-tripeptide--D-alanyl-D-alanine ligase [Deltaproteobacteria bacterium HGW-Deltaproteobacteria-14]
MKALTARVIAAAVHGELSSGDPARAFTRVFTDSREPIAGGLFFALTGDRFDGHRFVQPAVKAGAAGVIVSDEIAAGSLPDDVPVIVVGDTTKALTALAAHVRQAHAGRVIAVTGSVGKTTVKDMTAAGLSAFGTVHRTPGNWNNHLGLPLTLLATTGDEDFLVLELGMSAPGEIDALTRLARPHVGLVTGAVAAHLEFFESVDGIADAKGELYYALAKFSTAVANADDPRMLALAERAHGSRLLRYGRAADADVRLTAVAVDGARLTASIDVAGTPVTVKLQALGAHNAHNAAATLAIARALDLDPQITAAALSERFRPGKHRLSLVRAAAGLTVVDDCYNANPTSAVAALEALTAAAPAGAVKGAVLGTMRELGQTAGALHAEVGAAAGRLGFVWLAATGAHAADLARGATAAGVATVLTAADAAELEGAVRSFAAPDRWLLVKGSRGERLERVVEMLQDAATAGENA